MPYSLLLPFPTAAQDGDGASAGFDDGEHHKAVTEFLLLSQSVWQCPRCRPHGGQCVLHGRQARRADAQPCTQCGGGHRGASDKCHARCQHRAWWSRQGAQEEEICKGGVAWQETGAFVTRVILACAHGCCEVHVQQVIVSLTIKWLCKRQWDACYTVQLRITSS